MFIMLIQMQKKAYCNINFEEKPKKAFLKYGLMHIELHELADAYLTN